MPRFTHGTTRRSADGSTTDAERTEGTIVLGKQPGEGQPPPEKASKSKS